MLTNKETTSYIVGTTNAIFLHNRECNPDVIINVSIYIYTFKYF